MVTAVVHQAFGSDLRLVTEVTRLSRPLKRMALDRRQPLYLSSRFGRDLCFW